MLLSTKYDDGECIGTPAALWPDSVAGQECDLDNLAASPLEADANVLSLSHSLCATLACVDATLTRVSRTCTGSVSAACLCVLSSAQNSSEAAAAADFRFIFEDKCQH